MIEITQKAGTMDGMELLERTIREHIADWRKLREAGDEAGCAQIQATVAELCFPAVAKAAVKTFKPSENDKDDVIAAGQLIFLETLPKHMSRFEADKTITLASGKPGTFAGWVVYGCRTWVGEVKDLLQEQKGVGDVKKADQQMQRIYHGCREHFIATNGRDWSSTEAQKVIGAYLIATKKATYAAKYPDLSDSEVHEMAHNRIKRDGHLRTLRELDELVRLEQTMRTLPLDAPWGEEDGPTLGDTLASELADEQSSDAETLSTMSLLATLGMGPRETKQMLAHLENEENSINEELLNQSQETMLDPIAQYVALGEVELQFETTVKTTGLLAAREALVAAAQLGW